MKKLAKVISSALFIFILSCNKPTEIETLPVTPPVYKGLTVQGEHTEIIDEAIQFWNNSFGEGFLTKDAGKYPAYVVIVDNLELDVSGLAYKYDDHCLVKLKKKMAKLLIHELGHCMGLGHSNVTHSIMFPYILGNQEITQKTIEIINQGHLE